MVKATFVQGSKLPIQGFILSGHAGYAPHGEDIVCAGISGLSLGIANGLAEFLASRVNVQQGANGWLAVRVVEQACSDEDLCRAETLLRTLRLGLEQIAQRYPGSLDIIESEVFPDDSL